MHRNTTTRCLAIAVGLVVGLGMTSSAYAIGTKSWDKVIPNAAKRFKLRMGGAAVLDKETQLVWEQAPTTNALTWVFMRVACFNAVIGGRKGWRLPKISELTSLFDTTQSDPALPAGHPFVLPAATTIATSSLRSTGFFNVAFLSSGGTGQFSTPNGGNTPLIVWCVRGGIGADDDHE